MNVDVRDVDRTLEYRYATTVVRLLPTGLLLIFLSLVIYALIDPDREPVWTLIGIGVCFVMGIAVIGVALWTRSSPGKPLFTLSPAGIHGRIPWVKEFLIPWREIRGVDSIDIEAEYWSSSWHTRIPTFRRSAVVFNNVTVVLVPKQFYDSHIFVDSFFLRGPGWKANFIPKGPLVQVALHHELLSVEPQPLREAVEARWHAFRGQPVVETARTSVPRITAVGKNADAAPHPAPKSDVVVMGESPKSVPKWEAVKIAALLIGILAAATNIAGLWDLPGQDKDREARAKARAERQYWEESSRRMKEDSKRLEAKREKTRREIDETWRRFDRDRLRMQ